MIGRKSQRGQHFAESRIFGWLVVDVDHKFPLKCGKTAVLTPPPNKVDMRGGHYTQVKQSRGQILYTQAKQSTGWVDMRLYTGNPYIAANK